MSIVNRPDLEWRRCRYGKEHRLYMDDTYTGYKVTRIHRFLYHLTGDEGVSLWFINLNRACDTGTHFMTYECEDA